MTRGLRGGRRVNQNAVQHLASHPELGDLSDTELGRRFKELGFFSMKTFIGDIRVQRIREAAAALIRGEHGTEV